MNKFHFLSCLVLQVMEAKSHRSDKSVQILSTFWILLSNIKFNLIQVHRLNFFTTDISRSYFNMVIPVHLLYLCFETLDLLSMDLLIDYIQRCIKSSSPDQGDLLPSMYKALISILSIIHRHQHQKKNPCTIINL